MSEKVLSIVKKFVQTNSFPIELNEEHLRIFWKEMNRNSFAGMYLCILLEKICGIQENKISSFLSAYESKKKLPETIKIDGLNVHFYCFRNIYICFPNI